MPTRTTLLRRAIGVSAILMMVAAGAIAFSLRGSYKDALEDAHKNADNVAAILSHNVALSMRSIEIVLDQAQERLQESTLVDAEAYRTAAGTEEMHQFLRERLQRLPQAEAITFSAANGDIIVSSRDWPPAPRNFADRDYFVHQKEHRDGKTFVSLPANGKASGQWSIFFSRRVESQSGEFLGAIAVVAYPKHFLEAYSAIRAIKGASSLLANTNGTIYLRVPDARERTGETMSRSLDWLRVVGEGGGSFRTSGLFDEGARLAAVRPLQDYPLVVSVALSEETALEVWRARAKTTIAGGLICAGAMLWLLCVLYRNFENVTRSESKLDAAVAHMSQGLIMFDRDNRIVMHNERFCEMYNLDPGGLPPGAHRRDLLNQRIANGTQPVNNPDGYFPPESALTKASARIDELADGRSILVTRRLVKDGGWVTTHEDITDRQRAASRIEHMAHHDSLTGLPNRAMYLARIQGLVADAPAGAVAALLIDLDNFKIINDTHGHAAGDVLLKTVADRLRATIGPNDLAARLGGDEFAIICHDEAGALARAREIAQSLLDQCRDTLMISGKEIGIGFSIGIATLEHTEATPDPLIGRADIALYSAKDAGRKCYRVFEPGMEEHIKERRQLTADLHLALEHDELEMYYQPIVAAGSGEIRSMEALLRWKHPTRGFVSPAIFVPLAEESGLINAIGEWVLDRSCKDATTWPENVTVAVNFSALQVSRAEGIEAVRNALTASRLDPKRLELEVTETVLLAKDSANLDTLHELRNLGVSLSLDDFGTGFSSFSYLTTFAFDKIKIDKSFVDSIATNRGCAAIISATTSLARVFEAETIAEGVETEEQATLLRAAGVSEMQGYYFGKPHPNASWKFEGRHVVLRDERALAA